MHVGFCFPVSVVILSYPVKQMKSACHCSWIFFLEKILNPKQFYDYLIFYIRIKTLGYFNFLVILLKACKVGKKCKHWKWKCTKHLLSSLGKCIVANKDKLWYFRKSSLSIAPTNSSSSVYFWGLWCVLLLWNACCVSWLWEYTSLFVLLKRKKMMHL